jgi:hypothetical protein
METIFLLNGAITLILLVVHLADYFLSWPRQPFAAGRSRMTRQDTSSIKSRVGCFPMGPCVRYQGRTR